MDNKRRRYFLILTLFFWKKLILMFKSTFIFLLRNKNSKINSIKKKLVELIDRTVYLLVFNGSERLSGDGLQGTGYRVGYTEYCKYVLATVGD